LYIAGQFDSVGGAPRRNVAAVHLTDAKPTAFHAPPPEPNRWSAYLLVVSDRSLFVDLSDTGVVALDAVSGKRRRWRLQTPEVDALVSYRDTLIGAYQRASKFGSGTPVVVEYQTATGRALRTIASSRDGDEINTLQVHASRLYVGGVFSHLNKTARQSLATFDLGSSRLLPWHPDGAREGFGVTTSIAATATDVAVGVGSCRPTC
ncbi:MAG: hypothetical protein M3P18_00915, partial [Actinomycetota bacterium]|nr:hypothetical protein [Actinomycetota bacterium]